jgi:uncharacterized protein with PIN domain
MLPYNTNSMKDDQDSFDPGLDDDLDESPRPGLAEHLDELEHNYVRERRALARCPHCGSPNIRRSHSGGIVDKVMQIFGKRAYRCRDCRDRFHASRTLMRN